MFNMQGEVIGIVCRIVSRSGGSEGIGFAVTSNAAKEILLDAPAVWTGVTVVPLSGELARLLNLPQPAELLVMHAAEDSPGSQIGLRAGTTPAVVGGVNLTLGGDIILAVAGMTMEANAGNYRRIRDRLAAAARLRCAPSSGEGAEACRRVTPNHLSSRAREFRSRASGAPPD